MKGFSIAKQVLELWGASAEEIPTSAKEESDWLATLGGFRLLIEEKTKLENPEQASARSMALEANQVFGTTTPLSPNNRISGILRKAAGQLSSTAASVAHDARVLWMTGTGHDAEAKHYQTLSTLYGSTKVFELGKPGLRECYFFHNSDFFRFRNHFDAAVVAFLVADTVTMKLCLNPYAVRWQALRDSPFARKLPNGLIDPVAEEAAGDALIADTDIDRKDKDEVLRYLRTKYGVDQLLNMDMNMASAIVAMPK